MRNSPRARANPVLSAADRPRLAAWPRHADAPASVPSKYARRLVGGTVVDDDELPVVVGLRGAAVDGPLNVPRPVARGEHDGHEIRTRGRLAHTELFPGGQEPLQGEERWEEE